MLFAHPKFVQNAIEHALKRGNDPKAMREKPGEVMGYRAHGHPFLDGNGRAIMVIHSILAQRAGFSVDWASTDKTDYLQALTNELDNPGKGMLDKYLEPYIRPAVTDLKEHISAAKVLMAVRVTPTRFVEATTTLPFKPNTSSNSPSEKSNRNLIRRSLGAASLAIG